MKEIWKDIPNYDGLYQISSNGKIKSNRGHGKILKQNINRDGYYVIRLTKNKKRKEFFVHRLIAICFIEYKNNYKCLPDEINKTFDIDKLTVNHIDRIRLNNNIDNLEWCTIRYNIKYSLDMPKTKLLDKIKKVKDYVLKSNIDKTIKLEIINLLK